AVKRCIDDKITVVKQDPFEKKNIRNILNYGHTIGHSLEAASGFNITHGEAISVGMVMENRFGVEFMGMSPEGSVRTEDILRSFNLPVSPRDLNLPMDISLLKDTLLRDKKSRQGKILMPFIKEIGKAEVKSVRVEMLEEFLDREFA
ncbi:MAG: 3-dehydroquinate synthase, partial [Candidatus Thermoplasmatota archaeon]|nr:3-dehydroquinate synthase [Candidatus Thermoplasmatota archaeon]